MDVVDSLIEFFLWLLELKIPFAGYQFSLRSVIIFGFIAGICLGVYAWLRGSNGGD